MKAPLLSLLVLMFQATTPEAVSCSLATQNTLEACSGTDCSSLMTLDNAFQILSSNLTLMLEPGIHYVEEFVLIQNLTNLQIVGNTATIITCAPSIGLAFYNVSNLCIENIKIDGCSLNGTNLTSVFDKIESSTQSFYNFPTVNSSGVGLMFGLCSSVNIESVQIVNVDGFGLLGINIIGNSQLNNVTFSSNGVNRENCKFSESATSITNLRRTLQSKSEKFGGGAVFLYQDFMGDDQESYDDQRYSLEVNSSTFYNNVECSFVYRTYVEVGMSRYLDELGYRIGGGGAMTIILVQLRYSIDVTVKSTDFQSNSALLGSSIHAVLYQGLQDTHLTIDNCSFLGNGAPHNVSVGDSAAFGAAGIAFFSDIGRPASRQQYVSRILNNQNVTVKVLNSDFIGNRAQYGGAMYIYSAYQSPINDITTDVVKFLIEKCNIEQNQAFIGPAMSVYEFKFSGRAVGIQIHIKDTSFVDNRIETAVFDKLLISVSQNFGIIDLRSINITFLGNCQFFNNTGTAIRAEETLIGIAGNATFQGNTGINGGAFYLLSHTYLVMAPNSSLYLLYNVAYLAGGAFYVNEIGLNSFVSGGGLYEDCFLHFSYDDFIVCSNCSDLDTTGVYIQFSNNRAPSGSNVYGSALLSCPWALELLDQFENENESSIFQILNDHFPNVFSFDVNHTKGPHIFRSVPTSLQLKYQNFTINNSELEYNNFTIKISPGEVITLSLSAQDDFDQIVSTVVSSFVLNSTKTAVTKVSDDNFGFLGNNEPTEIPFRLNGVENQTVTVIIFSTEVGSRAQTLFSLEVVSCGFGFVFNSSQSICGCNNELDPLGVMCSTENHSLTIPDDIWVGPFPNSEISEIVIRPCLFEYCRNGERTVLISDDLAAVSLLDEQCSLLLHRAGFLCGDCIEGFSSIFGSRKCLECSNIWLLILVPFLLGGFLIIFIIRFLDLNITGGYINGILFYSNIVSLYGQSLVPHTVLKSLFLISLPTLNLGIETCFYDGMTSLQRVWWQLSFPLYLFVLMGGTVVLARMKVRKFRENLSGLSTIQMLATLLVICYVSVLQASIELVTAVRVESIDGKSGIFWLISPSYKYFGLPHAPLGLLAMVLLIVYILPLPIFLLFPSFVYRLKNLSKYKPIYDAFWVPFKPRYRFWLGMRLIFRWVPFVLAFAVRAPINLYVTTMLLIFLLVAQSYLQPYDGLWRNRIDCIFLLNAIVILSTSVFFYAEIDPSQENLDRETFLNRNDTGAHVIRIFIILGFLQIVAVCFYCVLVKFPKLKNFFVKIYHIFLCKKSGKYDATNPSTIDPSDRKDNKDEQVLSGEISNVGSDSETVRSSNTSEPTQVDAYAAAAKKPNFSAAVLREPLLESGFLELDKVESPAHQTT